MSGKFCLAQRPLNEQWNAVLEVAHGLREEAATIIQLRDDTAALCAQLAIEQLAIDAVLSATTSGAA